MFAVIRTGGKQYRVAPNDIIEIEKIAGEPGDIVQLGEVILLGGDGGPKTGSPTISGASVAAEVLEQKRDDKIIVFKKKRRKGYRRTKGHRQALTALRITEILTDGKKPSKAAAKPEPKKAEAPKPKPEAKKAEAKPAAKKPEAKPAAKKAEAKPAAKKPAAKAAAKKPAKAAAKAPAKKPAPKKK
ncbi:MAG: 50S ribosomal protein L21 [Methyloceanibacter sp.]|uniref:50S ribosomal protein L21 n=1 Tax=Methyloceanibacter sp. TaxID=1965321 RepID=UPI003D6D8E06